MFLLLLALGLGVVAGGCGLEMPSIGSIGDTPDQSRNGDSGEPGGDQAAAQHQQIGDDAFDPNQPAGGAPPVSIVEAGTREPRTLNPVLVSDPLSEELSHLVFSGLVNIDPENGQPEADLANHWEVSQDGTTYRFNLREGIQWHDGEPFSAADVVFTYELMMNDKTRSPRYSRLVERVASVEAMGSHSVEFQLVSPYAPFLTSIATFGIVPEHILSSVLPEELVTDPFGISSAVGTGPFTLEQWNRGGRIIFQANPNYHRSHPAFDRYEYQVAPDQQAILEGLQSGSIDWARVGPNEADEAAAMEQVELRSVPSFEMISVVLQLDPGVTPIFQEPRVRKALMLALDRRKAVNDVWNGHARVAHGTIPPASQAAADASVQYDSDPARAKTILDEAGWIPGENGVRVKDGQPLRFDLIANGDNPLRQQLAEWLAGKWREIGVDARLQYETWGNVRDRITHGRDFDALVLGYRWDIDPDQRSVFSSDSITDAFNLGAYMNPDVDGLLDDALATTDMDERAALYQEVQDRVMDDLPILPLVFPDQTIAVGPRLHDERLTAILLRNRSSVTDWVLNAREPDASPEG